MATCVVRLPLWKKASLAEVKQVSSWHSRFVKSTWKKKFKLVVITGENQNNPDLNIEDYADFEYGS